MAICLNNLKSEIKTLERLFHKNHELFQIVNASVDELTCRLITKNGKKYDIHANITVSPFFIFSLHAIHSRIALENLSLHSVRCFIILFTERLSVLFGGRFGRPNPLTMPSIVRFCHISNEKRVNWRFGVLKFTKKASHRSQTSHSEKKRFVCEKTSKFTHSTRNKKFC